jgi:CRISPR system Cascade subunit CasD
MQSWGTQSRFSVRDTGLEPSKSGVIGLLCAALGRPRTQPLDDLAALKMGVRVDREGLMKKDFHTAKDVAKAGGGTKDCELSTRYYLADADFLVGLEGDRPLLERLDRSLAAPVWALCLGRKSFVPGVPVRLPDALSDRPVRDALCALPWTARNRREAQQPPAVRLRLVLDAPFGTTPEVRCDLPAAPFSERRFTLRHVTTEFIPLAPDMIRCEEAAP